MELSKQVCSLEQCKKLKELGVAQDSIFYHQHLPELIYRRESQLIVDMGFIESVPDLGERYSAFTVAELGVMLPHVTLTGWMLHDKHSCAYYKDNIHNNTQYGNTEAEARAAMLIHLLENNLTTADEVNAHLLTTIN